MPVLLPLFLFPWEGKNSHGEISILEGINGGLLTLYRNWYFHSTVHIFDS